MIHSFKIRPVHEGMYQTYIDDKKVSLSKVDVRLRSDEYPTVRCEFMADNDLDIQAMLELSDKNLLEMVKRRLADKEFFRSLLWVINENE